MNQTDTVKSRADRLNIGIVMLLVVGVAIGIWLVGDDLKELLSSGKARFPHWGFGWLDSWIAVVAGSLLGGRSLIGPPLLLLRGRRRPWGPGRILWFTYGTATWVFWAPVFYLKAIDDNQSHRTRADEEIVLALPSVTSLFTMPAVVASGALGRSRRSRLFRSWQERFGVLLGAGWTCLGLYWVAWIYREILF